MHLSDTRLKNYSRTERKLLEQYSSGDYIRVFYPTTPIEVLNFVCAREKSAGFYWCPEHNEWEQAAHACFPDVTPSEYKHEGGNNGGFKKEEGESGEGSGQQGGQQGDGAEEQRDQENEKHEGEQKSEMKLSDCKEVEWTDKKVASEWQTDILEHFPEHQWEKGKPEHTIRVAKKTGESGLFKVNKDGRVHFGGMERIVGKLTQPQQQQDQKQQEKESEKKKKEEKRWLKFILNKCPQCQTETLQKVWQQPPVPENEEDRLDYTETACGCDALKDIFKTDEALVDDPSEWGTTYHTSCSMASPTHYDYVCTKRKGHKGLHVARWGYNVTDPLCAIDPWK